MNQIKTNNSGELAQTAPLFASSWLALFDLLYSYFIDRRSAQAEVDH